MNSFNYKTIRTVWSL